MHSKPFGFLEIVWLFKITFHLCGLSFDNVFFIGFLCVVRAILIMLLFFPHYRLSVWLDLKALPGVEITTRQLAKCEWNLELASNILNLLAKLASVFFFLLSVSLLLPLIKCYSSPTPKYKHAPDTVIYLLLWHTYCHWHCHGGLLFE
jgi:uncharacterized membrane protein YqjE